MNAPVRFPPLFRDRAEPMPLFARQERAQGLHRAAWAARCSLNDRLAGSAFVAARMSPIAPHASIVRPAFSVRVAAKEFSALRHSKPRSGQSDLKSPNAAPGRPPNNTTAAPHRTQPAASRRRHGQMDEVDFAAWLEHTPVTQRRRIPRAFAEAMRLGRLIGAALLTGRVMACR